MDNYLPSAQLAESLSKTVIKWSSYSTTTREEAVNNLRGLLIRCSSTSFINISFVSLHSFSRLLSQDAAIAQPKPYWSRHPQYSEPLIISLLEFFYTCLTPHDYLPPSGPSAFVQLFVPESTDSIPFGAVDDSSYQILKDEERNEHLDAMRDIFEKAPPDPYHFSFAFLISQLIALATEEPAINIRHLSLCVLTALVNVLDGPLLASFLPGITSTLTNILARSPRLHSALAFPALRALHFLIIRVFPSRADESPQNANTDSIADALEAISMVEPPTNWGESVIPSIEPKLPAMWTSESRPKSLHVTIDSDWVTTTAQQLRSRITLIVTSHTGPRFHTMGSVRIAFIRFVSELLDQKYLSFDAFHISVLKFALIEACANPIPTIAHEASRAVRRFLNSVGVMHFERAIVASLRFGGFSENSSSVLTSVQENETKAIQALSAAADEAFSTNLSSGCLFVLVPFDMNCPMDLSEDDFIIPLQRLPAFLNRIGVVPFVRLLLFLHESQWHSFRVLVDTVYHALRNRVLMVARCLGKIDLLSSVHDTLLAFSSESHSVLDKTSENHLGYAALPSEQGDVPDCNMAAFKKRAHAALLLCAVVKGALCQKIMLHSPKSLETHYIGQCAKETLEGMSKLFVPSMKHATLEEAREIDDTVLTLKLALLQYARILFDDLSEFQRNIGEHPIGSDVVLLCLLNLLRDVSHGETSIREEAHSTLVHMSHVARCRTERKLLMRHLNYVIARVIRNLHESWAADVLRFVVGHDGDDVSNEATLLLQRTLKGLSDGLAGAGDERAMVMLASMRSVLTVACAQKERQGTVQRQDQIGDDVVYAKQFTQKDDSIKKRSMKSEFAVVQRALMYYCTEKIHAEDEPPGEESSTNQNDAFDDDDESDKRNTFEEVAENVLDGARDMLVGRPWNLRASALECATLAVRLLKGRKKFLLPHVAKLLPMLPDQFVSMNESLNAGERMLKAMKERKARRHDDGDMIGDLVFIINRKGTELPVVQNVCLLLSALAECAGSFIRERFVRLIFPKMRPLLRLCHYFPTLLTHRSNSEGMGENYGMVPSYGAMGACDACLEALASIAEHTPIALARHAGVLTKFLAVFLDERNDPESGPNRVVVSHANRSMVRYEKERWIRREQLAKKIIASSVKVNSGDSFCSLLYADERGPSLLHGGHEDLYDIVVRSKTTNRV